MFIFIILLSLCQTAIAVSPLVDLSYTKIQGTALSSGVTQWLGVRYAAPPVGTLRFAAPIDPPATTGGIVVDATRFQPICLPNSPTDFTMKPNKRFTVAEDCLFVNVFAPSGATPESKLGVMYFVQGGGFGSNSNANFNGSDLALFGNIVVVQVNYRVGVFGFAQSKEIKAGGSLNNGLKDVVQGLKWTKQHISSFGGNPEQMVASGDSAGASALALLLAAFADNDPGLFKGVIMESPSVATIRSLEQGQEQYACLTNATKCNKTADTLACLRSLNATALQTTTCQFNPHLDDDLVKKPSLDSFAAGAVLKIPTIAGTCTDEGTKNVPKDTNTTAQALQFVNDQAFGALSNSSLSLIAQTYLNAPQPVFPNSGRMWRQLANAHGDFRAHCITARLQDGLAAAGTTTYNYRYAVLDEQQEALGFGAYHTVELNGVFGAANTDGAPPASYRSNGTNAAIVPITMAYWASFVKTLDPNADRAPGTPEWKPWTVAGQERLRFQTGNIGMEKMNDTQNARCTMLNPMLAAVEVPTSKPGTLELNSASGVGNASSTGPGIPQAQSGGDMPSLATAANPIPLCLQRMTGVALFVSALLSL
ncbi:carboxylesterase [Clohesyomyces aquaticus]|uniref:Carboxylesterase n=1 Tax=Clohesyomyces aquaticus TaxID=1231657 RepID=A0A1Y2A6U8_9PLEO|nr:carboxylesterase [Clohesyomyces aquaticus]